MKRSDRILARQALEAAGPAPAMGHTARGISVAGVSGRDGISFMCTNCDEVEAYVRKVVAHAPHVVVTVDTSFHDSTDYRRLTFSLDDDCPGLPDGPVHREHLRFGLTLAHRAADLCMEAARQLAAVEVARVCSKEG